MTSIQCLNFLDHPKKIPPPKRFAFFSSHRGSAGNAEVRRIFHSAHPTWSRVPRRFFFSKLMKKPWIKAVVFGDFEKHVHIKKGSYKHMQVEPLASVFDLYQNHTMVPFATNLSYILFGPFSGDTFSFEGASVPISTLYRSFQEFSVTAVCRVSNWHTSPTPFFCTNWLTLASPTS